MNCPNCERQMFKDDAKFCSECGKQARCLNLACRAVLAPRARACMECGTLVGEGATPVSNAQASASAPMPGLLPNRIRLIETPKSRRLEADLTDYAVDSLGDSFAALAVGRFLPGGGRRGLTAPTPLIRARSPCPKG